MTQPTRLHAVAPAKVNLGLEVVGRRPDGYHELVSLFQAVSLFDEFEWKDTSEAFSYESPPGVSPESDLVARALSDAPDRDSWTGRLRVVKRIPIAAGLGGGSSDAAFALRLAFPRASSTELHERAAALGADVPFFLRAGTALATGIGTTLEWLPTTQLWLVLVTPPLVIERKTAVLYGGLEPEDFSDGSAVRDLTAELLSSSRKGDSVNRPRRRQRTWSNARTLASRPGTDVGDSPNRPCDRGDNTGITPSNAFLRQLLGYDMVRYAYDALRRAGGESVSVSVSGAGPTMYAVAHDWCVAWRIAERLPRNVGRVHIVRSIGSRASDPAIERMAIALRGRMSAGLPAVH